MLNCKLNTGRYGLQVKSLQGKEDMRLCRRAAPVGKEEMLPLLEQGGTSRGGSTISSLVGMEFDIPADATLTEQFKKRFGIDNAENLMAQVERFLAFLVVLDGCHDNMSAISAAVYLYLNKNGDKSVTERIIEFVSSSFCLDEQMGEDAGNSLVTTEEKQETWADMLKAVRKDWKSVRNNKFFTSLSKLLGFFVSFELCERSTLTFEYKGFKIWEPALLKLHNGAFDLFDAFLDTATYFVETISLCWKHQSLKPMFVGSEGLLDIDNEFMVVTQWWDLVQNGNLQKVKGVEDSEFDSRLETLLTHLKSLEETLDKLDKRIVAEKRQRLLLIKNAYISLKISSGVRRSPFCLEFFGASSQGKTTCSEQIIHALLVSAGLSTSKERQCTYNPSDRYMSNWKTNALVMLIDDIANAKSNFVERPPTQAIIDVANNAPYYANMADLASKGKVFVEPELVIATTNVKDLDARIYSNCPYSIQRRMHVVITVKAKLEFQYLDARGVGQGIDPVKVKNAKNNGSPFDDIWELTLEKAVQPRSLKNTASYAPIIHNGKPLVDVPFVVALDYLIDTFHEHRNTQRHILDRMKSRKHVTRCTAEGCMQIRGMCLKHDDDVPRGIPSVSTRSDDPMSLCTPVCSDSGPTKMENQMGFLSSAREHLTLDSGSLFDSLTMKGFQVAASACGMEMFRAARSNVITHSDTCSDMLTKQCKELSKNFFNRMELIHMVPTWIADKPWFVKYALWMHSKTLRRVSMGITIGLFGPGYCMTVRSLVKSKASWGVKTLGFAGLNLLSYAWYSINKCAVENAFVWNMSRMNNNVNPLLKKLRDDHVREMCTGCALLVALYNFRPFYKRYTQMDDQGNLAPETGEDVKERDGEQNVWGTPYIEPLPVREETATTSPDQLEKLVTKNMRHVILRPKGGDPLTANCLFLTTNVMVLPYHYVRDHHDVAAEFIGSNPANGGGKFRARISKDNCVRIGSHDCVLCYVPSGGSHKDLRKYIPEKTHQNLEFKILYRSVEGAVTEGTGICSMKKFKSNKTVYNGYQYDALNVKTFAGLCGSPIVSRMRPMILGVHVAGVKDTTTGASAPLLKKEVDAAFEKLRLIEGVLIPGSGEHFPRTVLGRSLLTEVMPHHKSPMNYLPPDTQVQYHGQCPGMSTFKSDVKVTPLSEHVIDVCGKPNKYRPPIVNPQYKGWQTCLENMSNVGSQFESRVLQAAVADYKSDLMPIFKDKLWNDAKPLTHEQNLWGEHGVRFIDPMKMKTSVGFPLSGPKLEHLVEVDGVKTFKPEIMAEIDRCHEAYKRGERAYTVAKACKKDEVLDKEKCRIFYSNSVALTYLLRKYFLPLVRVLQFNPLVAECAVGINSHGPEWEQLHQHVLKFGKDRIIGGDYGKYDQKLPSQIVLAAFRILIDFAEVCQYSKEDLAVMEAMASDIVYSVIAFNGDLVSLLEGAHISGNPLTVILNGIGGSLNLRCVFFDHLISNNLPMMAFRSVIALMTYGDDSIGSVSKKIDFFTIKKISEFLGNHGQVYTMPDKTSELTDFLPYEKFEFLKRKSVFHEDFNCHVGALADDSCFKMLHCYMRNKKSPLTEDCACALNIDTAIREWFNHGKDVFEMRQGQMREVAQRAGISHLCRNLDLSFEEFQKRWHATYVERKYVPQYESYYESSVPIVFE